MRVLAGTLKGQRLSTPKGRTTRPTADQVRIACLDTLMPYLGDGSFLDLFAGAGGVGIEALSRGAPSAVFVEQDAQALRALRDNVERLGLAERARVVRDDAAPRGRRARGARARASRWYSPIRRTTRPARRPPCPRWRGACACCRGRWSSSSTGPRRRLAPNRRARPVEDAAIRGDDLDFLSLSCLNSARFFRLLPVD